MANINSNLGTAKICRQFLLPDKGSGLLSMTDEGVLIEYVS